MFCDEEIERYKRHLILKDVGGPGQQKLKAARVLVIGAGGLGSPVLAYLAAAGVGTLGIVDDDHVSLSNLQRQIIHESEAVGIGKVKSASKTIRRINPHVKISPFITRIDADNALEIIGQFDLVVDGSDNFATRYLVNDACYLAKKPLVFAAVGPFDGQLTLFKSYEKSASGDPNPSYRCLFPDAPEENSIPNCSQVGILGAVVGVMGTLCAMEVLKELLGLGEPLVGRLMIYEALAPRFTTINYGWDENSPLNGKQPTILSLLNHKP
ncbi:MAG: molybdopterin-synthase adenylyltransferase MoeB [Hyphomicrobiaceae bacterium]|nr:molybdopterin-synthase adenylyltransferase MoeB [Hyphomicrobiaceae bacterium]